MSLGAAGHHNAGAFWGDQRNATWRMGWTPQQHEGAYGRLGATAWAKIDGPKNTAIAGHPDAEFSLIGLTGLAATGDSYEVGTLHDSKLSGHQQRMGSNGNYGAFTKTVFPGQSRYHQDITAGAWTEEWQKKDIARRLRNVTYLGKAVGKVTMKPSAMDEARLMIQLGGGETFVKRAVGLTEGALSHAWPLAALAAGVGAYTYLL